MADRLGIVLVGHGAPAADCPPELVAKLKRLEAERRRRGGPPSEEEREVERAVREWPRTAENDPYRLGLEALVSALAAQVPEARVVAAYNEFCAPTLEQAVLALASAGHEEIVVVPSMLTRGGVHSEVEIPEAIEALAPRLPPGARVRYAWPFVERDVAALLAARVRALAAR